MQSFLSVLFYFSLIPFWKKNVVMVQVLVHWAFLLSKTKKIIIINKEVGHLYLSSTLLYSFLKKKGYKLNTARKAIMHLFRR